MGPGGPGGWMGVERSLGGMSSTFGLQRHYDPGGRPPLRLERAQLQRIVRYFTPYWRQWLAIFLCLAATAGLGVLPPLCVRGILDHAIPGRDGQLLVLLVGAIVALNVLAGL